MAAASDIDLLDAYISTYPKVITLAQILAAYRRRLWDSTASAAVLAVTACDLHNDINRRVHICQPYTEMRPIESWIYDQRVVALNGDNDRLTTARSAASRQPEAASNEYASDMLRRMGKSPLPRGQCYEPT